MWPLVAGELTKLQLGFSLESLLRFGMEQKSDILKCARLEFRQTLGGY